MIAGTPTENAVSITVIKSKLKIKELRVGDIVTVDEDKTISATGTSGCLVSRVTTLDSINPGSPWNHVLNFDPVFFSVRFVIG
jgi:hypothetical protein